ncbi:MULTISPECIES: efflux RND transporter periplasmic adaptor subunit [unclassified Microbulbifer]|uniref:efflux RND transporter periplasmic adaptor subunit n=1 Tax=unclassified Microbulbifer TaxID=2619833 RepID=UPI0027E4C382|nr:MULTISPECIES: efflux RND transporter periplasmic adaptor subunit [unclassified Microbulbifer]
MNYRNRIAPLALLSAVVGLGTMLGAWKYGALQQAEAASATQPEPMETVTAVTAEQREQRPTTTAVGTVLALRSISLRNELAGAVRRVNLTPGAIVEAGTPLVTLDVSVEEAELAAHRAEAQLAETVYRRLTRLRKTGATSQDEVDRAKAELDVARAEIRRAEAVIERKTIRAPFRARVGLADVHPGQYLSEGTLLTTLQGVGDGVHVDFTVAQQVAEQLREGDTLEILSGISAQPTEARVVALDARIDPETRNAAVRARIDGAERMPAPGASVQVRVPVGPARLAVTVPVSALRRGPEGDQVFVIERDAEGNSRAHLRRVQAGTVLGDSVVVEGGLEAGEAVAAAGSFKLYDGALVAIADAQLASN